MEFCRGDSATTKAIQVPILHAIKPLPQTTFNRIFAAVYSCAILALLYHHVKTLLCSTSCVVPFSLAFLLMISDLVLSFTWFTGQAFRMSPISRKEFPENLEKAIKRSDYPALDVFICTADPYKEPPMSTVNTALSVMAYDYPTEKLSVYVSDDGGSELTFFAFLEAAKFASHWLPFCRKNDILERSPNAYFESNHLCSSETQSIKTMYEIMKARVEQVIERGKVGDEYITSDQEREAFSKWTDNFTSQNHPTIIQVLLESSQDKDVAGYFMPNLIYVSREKCKTSPHHFKAGALNVLLRVSATMTNAPIILTLDCDTYSNDPRTPIRALCYFSDPKMRSQYSFIQFPQRFQGINKSDIYAGEFKTLFQTRPMGLDGLMGCNNVGTGCVFSRRAFFGSPSRLVPPEITELGPDHVVDNPIHSQETLALAYKVAGCDYEQQTNCNWGSKMGFRYGSLIEDYFTGYRLHCEGWRSIFCNPDKAAFLGTTPSCLIDMLNQHKRWAIGDLQVAFSKYNPLIYGMRNMGPLMALCYSNYAFWPIPTVPVLVYAFLPQLALLNNVFIFPKVSDPWFLLYVFLVLGAYGQDFLEFVMADGTFKSWWNDQRIWNIRALSCFLFGSVEFLLKSLHISSVDFSVTSKVVDDAQGKRYEQGIFEFGVPSPMFVPLATAALINLVSFLWGLVLVFKGDNLDEQFVQLFIAGYGVVNCWPIYEAMAFRNDKGKLPSKIIIIAAFLALSSYIAASFVFKKHEESFYYSAF